ncbi:hypothetical protein CYMTET_13222 [Cymbomonas tetramitiformis]|uniref:Uncharacterized protein n=1 Tax=Cymbomonas tetramitiformis TaxID=36881 RepID=A0AAE0GK43_9CHLO|nr:hypothetical protein CYMTET_13222 [Cymbomonas tetramitiformis]
MEFVLSKEAGQSPMRSIAGLRCGGWLVFVVERRRAVRRCGGWLVFVAEAGQSLIRRLACQFARRFQKSEAERKRIEAKGIADFQHIVSKGINGHTLEWKGIEATEKLAKSDNNKVVVIGSLNGGGLPFILGDDRAH